MIIILLEGGFQFCGENLSDLRFWRNKIWHFAECTIPYNSPRISWLKSNQVHRHFIPRLLIFIFVTQLCVDQCILTRYLSIFTSILLFYTFTCFKTEILWSFKVWIYINRSRCFFEYSLPSGFPGYHLPILCTTHSCWHNGHLLFCTTHSDIQQLWNEWLHSPQTTEI